MMAGLGKVRGRTRGRRKEAGVGGTRRRLKRMEEVRSGWVGAGGEKKGGKCKGSSKREDGGGGEAGGRDQEDEGREQVGGETEKQEKGWEGDEK